MGQIDQVLPALPAVPAINTEVTWFDSDAHRGPGGRGGFLDAAGIIGVIKPTGQAVTLRVKVADVLGDDSRLTTINGNGSGQNCAAGVPTNVIVAFAAPRVVITVATGGTAPSAWFGAARLTDRSVL